MACGRAASHQRRRRRRRQPGAPRPERGAAGRRLLPGAQPAGAAERRASPSASAAMPPCRRSWPRGFAGVPTVLHEQNAVLGRANRLLARRATRIAASFPGAHRRSRPCHRHRQPGAPGHRRAWRSRPTRRRKRAASSACWSPAAARAPAPSAACCRRPSHCCRKTSAAASPWCSNAAPRTWSG